MIGSEKIALICFANDATLLTEYIKELQRLSRNRKVKFLIRVPRNQIYHHIIWKDIMDKKIKKQAFALVNDNRSHAINGYNL